MTTKSKSGPESILYLQAFILETQIDHPDKYVIANGDEEVLLSDILKRDPSLLPRLIRERAEVYRQLGWGSHDFA